MCLLYLCAVFSHNVVGGECGSCGSVAVVFIIYKQHFFLDIRSFLEFLYKSGEYLKILHNYFVLGSWIGDKSLYLVSLTKMYWHSDCEERLESLEMNEIILYKWLYDNCVIED